MAKQLCSNEEVLTPKCEACLREGKTVNAKIYCTDCEEYMCINCKTYHGKIKPSLNHKVFDSESNSEEIKAGKLLRQLTRCPQHKLEEVNYLCSDHDTTCCNECAIVNHRKCEHLVSLKESVQLLTEDGINAEKKLKEIEHSINTLAETERKKQDDVQEVNDEIQRDLTAFKTKIDEAYNKLETTVLKDVKDKCDRILETRSANGDEIENLKRNVSLLKQTEEAVRNNGESKCTILFKRKLRKELQVLEEKIRTLSEKSASCDIRLVAMNPVDDIIELIGSCLQVKPETLKSNSCQSLPSATRGHGGKGFRERIATLEKELDYDSYGCPKYCSWTDKYIVVALQDQLELLQFDAEKMAFVSAYKCSSYPCSMTRIDDISIAVSLPEVKSISIINVSQRQLELKSKLNTKFAYHAISYNSSIGQLLCFSQTAGTIDFLNVEGHQMYSVQPTKNVLPKLQSAHAVAFDQVAERIYLSCTDWDTVVALDKNGKLLRELSTGETVTLVGPLDVVLDPEGNVYVFGRGGNPILQCGKDLTVIREIIHTESKLEYAYSMSFNKDMSKFVVSEQHGLGSVYLKVYSFK